MTQATPSAARRARGATSALLALPAGLVALAMLSVGTTAARAQNPATATQAAVPAGYFVLKGLVVDSVHTSPLAGATVAVEGTNRRAVTDADGRYRIDSIPAGPHAIVVMHPLLDTLGLSIHTPKYNMGANDSNYLDLVIPGGDHLASLLCNEFQRKRGPAVMVGFVTDPDTKAPAAGTKVQLVYDQADPIGRKMPVVREQVVDSSGYYKICGLPGDMDGKVQVFRNGVSSGEVPVAVANGFVALRSLSIVSQHQAVVQIKNDSGKVVTIAKGSARLTGKVVNKLGEPLAGARVTLEGGGTPTISRPDGVFTLDSLPSGTQTLQVRKLGYAMVEVPVELSSTTPAHTTVKMNDYVQTLAAMRTEATENKALSDLGYYTRKNMGFGYFMDGSKVNRNALIFSDVMRTAPGLVISPSGDGRTYEISDARNQANGCVNFWVDNVRWQEMSPGDLDDYVRPSEVVAVEVYHGSGTPPQFTVPGMGDCATVVIWTQAKAGPQADRTKKKP